LAEAVDGQAREQRGLVGVVIIDGAGGDAAPLGDRTQRQPDPALLLQNVSCGG